MLLRPLRRRSSTGRAAPRVVVRAAAAPPPDAPLPDAPPSGGATADSDADRERGRQFRRNVFYLQDWRQHRSITRFFRHIRGILFSRIVRGLLPPLVCVLLSSYLVCTYEELWQEGALDEFVPFIPWPDIAVSPEGPFAISTFALSLLLVFRTNSSYERWWEASSAWNAIVSASIHLARQACQWLPAAGDAPARDALLRWLRAFPRCAAAYLREEEARVADLVDG